VSWRGTARRSLPYLMTAAGGFILAYLLVAFFLFPETILPNDARVPNVVGLTYDDAVRRLTRDGFESATRERRYHASAPEGMVLSQLPTAGSSEAKGTEIKLDVSLGQRTGTVPPVAGMTVAQAQRALAEVGLEPGELVERESEAPRGQVVGSEPREGSKIPLPGSVNIVVSGGPQAVAVPDATGQDETEARSLLEQVGFRVDVRVDSLSTLPVGTVVAQTPAAGRRALAGSTVTITVSGAATP
jgi:serine/threonine-protein kinase